MIKARRHFPLLLHASHEHWHLHLRLIQNSEYITHFLVFIVINFVFSARTCPNCCKCIFLDFVVHQILPYQSVSVDTFNSKNDVFVAIAQPSMENCMVLEWDHIEMNFRSYDNITGTRTLGSQLLMDYCHFTRKIVRARHRWDQMMVFVLHLYLNWQIKVHNTCTRIISWSSAFCSYMHI